MALKKSLTFIKNIRDEIFRGTTLINHLKLFFKNLFLPFHSLNFKVKLKSSGTILCHSL
ncbi:hypothetical protein EUBHAL_01972 [Anaerobutyricum hallii DSM 3353]|uniref:Uncharacterized protein n=1 Tax=Anaerobutyricum hallii DSM 3353 TaxID=411469 RepID=C0EX31_9FIRM|nr:hypothetical protein EUBHAL_01972 [Anaerobutyricum hallii DSM 3353]